MTHAARPITIAVCACGLGALFPAVATAQKGAPNALDIVVGNGPMAGTYKAPGSEVICMHMKAQHQFFASYKNFGAAGPKGLAEAGIKVDNADDAAPKWGMILMTFGDKVPVSYTVSIDRKTTGPLTMSRTGAKGEIAFQGKTTDGIQLKVTAKCADIDEM
ncbi:MAG: hypothetical protein M3081_13860 [Gemmatimonadota bacterium]|nr:hypothetical protein [Gemmatimonadota bacterium]